jgi:NAD(P)-dependent dehydrogenase (short-subunit alcohol dehydrogenase family)
VTKTAAQDLAEEGNTVNLAAPGLHATDRLVERSVTGRTDDPADRGRTRVGTEVGKLAESGAGTEVAHPPRVGVAPAEGRYVGLFLVVGHNPQDGGLSTELSSRCQRSAPGTRSHAVPGLLPANSR